MQTPTGTLESRIQYRTVYGNIEKPRRFWLPKTTPPTKIDTPSEKKGNSMYGLYAIANTILTQKPLRG